VIPEGVKRREEGRKRRTCHKGVGLLDRVQMAGRELEKGKECKRKVILCEKDKVVRFR